MNVFEKVVSIYFFRYDLAVKIIEFRSFRFLKFLYCFQCLFVFPVCNILIRIYNYFFFMKNKWRIIRGCTQIWNFSSSIQLNSSNVSAENKRDIELNTSREILYLRAAMYYLFIIHKGGRVQELECGQGGGTRQGGQVDNGTVLC